jgi:hypothetical protein
MIQLKFIIFASALLIFSSLSYASNMQVEAAEPALSRLQGSVKVLRDHHYLNASYGMKLQKGDVIYTGRRGKVYIDFPDNSRVKLGSKARFQVQNWENKQGIFTSALNIFQGAFRYTAGLIRGYKARQTTVTTKTAVLGVRGTDFWGRVEEDKTFFLLLEGEVSLTPIHGEKTIYNQALYAVNIKDTSISTPQNLDMKTIAPLAAETEIDF